MQKFLCLQGSMYNWVFWHRIHHKFYCTARDPYNHKKGFLYSHVISNVLSAPSDLEKYAKDIDMRDIEADGFVWIQRKYDFSSWRKNKDLSSITHSY